MVETDYYIGNQFEKCVAVLTDIHERRVNDFIRLLEIRQPDYVVVAGDVVDGKIIKRKIENHEKNVEMAIDILNQLSKIAPTYFSLGNHEKLLTSKEIQQLANSNAVALYDAYTKVDGLYIGGLSSGVERDLQEKVDIEFIEAYDAQVGYKVLLCHHPEYYHRYLKDKTFDLIISGHAHGGQVRIFGRGLFAPGQGILPKYTSGIHDGKLIISRGIAGTELFPRINNKSEIVYVHI